MNELKREVLTTLAGIANNKKAPKPDRVKAGIAFLQYVDSIKDEDNNKAKEYIEKVFGE